MKMMIWIFTCLITAGLALGQHSPEEEGHNDHAGHSHAAREEVQEPAVHDGHDHEAHEEHVEQTSLPAHSEHEGCDHEHGQTEVSAPHDDHEGHDHSANEDAAVGVELPDEMIEKIGIQLQKAAAGTVAKAAVFPAEIKLNRDWASAVSSRYPSLVRQVFAEIGDEVRKGDVLASLENRETMAVYMIQAPRDGVIISKDLAVGEAAPEDRVLYEVADLSSVWVDISIFPKYQHLVRKGMEVEFTAHDGHTASGVIKYISPIVSPVTRTFTARCVLEGAREDFTPGVFVRARIVVEQADAEVAVPVSAVQNLDGHPVVFVPGEHGFQTLEIRTGLTDGRRVEVLSGLTPGDEYVAEGAFALKAQMLTSGMDPHAGHGH